MFARRMRECRKRRDWSARELAERVAKIDPDSPLSRAAIGKIELGTRGIGLDEVVVIAAALSVPPSLLFESRPDEPWRVRIGANLAVTSREAWRWEDGERPLPGRDPEGKQFYARLTNELRGVIEHTDKRN
jgi:transcriptional regulator with XRE-family HTH domain